MSKPPKEKPPGPRDLTENEKSWILEDTFQSVQIDQTLKKVEMSRRQFSNYLKRDKAFAREYELAQLESCAFIENDMLNVYKKVDDHKLARVALEAMNKILVFRNPQKYSQKIDLNVNQNVSIRDNLQKSRERIESMLKEVNPALVLTGKVKKGAEKG